MEKSNENAVNEKKELFDLLLNAKSGSKQAFDLLIKKYEPLLVSRISAHKLDSMSDQDVEDMRQEALIIFYNAVCSFDADTRDIEFGLYAKICLENGLISFVRSYVRHIRRSLSLYGGDQGELGGISQISDPMQEVIDKESLSTLINLIQGNLSEYESRVWWLYVSGMSVGDIAARLGGVDPKSVSNAIYRIRKKLRSCLSDK